MKSNSKSRSKLLSLSMFGVLPFPESAPVLVKQELGLELVIVLALWGCTAVIPLPLRLELGGTK
jgi:hypothetical protein